MIPICSLFHYFHIFCLYCLYDLHKIWYFVKFCELLFLWPDIFAIYLPVSGLPLWWPYTNGIAHTLWIGSDRDFPLVFLDVCLISNSTVLILWFLSQYWPFLSPSIGCHFPLILVPSVVDEPSINHALAEYYEHFLGLRSSIGTSFEGGVSGFWMGSMGKWATSSVLEGKDSTTISCPWRSNSNRYQFHCNTFPPMAKPVKDSVFEWIQFIVVSDALMTIS